MNDFIYKLDSYLCTRMRAYFSAPMFSENNVIHRCVSHTFKKYVSHYRYSSLSEQGDTIWIFWWQGLEQMPPVVRACYQSVLKNKGIYKVILLDKTNYQDYVDIPEYIISKLDEGKISITHFSDVLRFNLLGKYGGWWLDATIYTTHVIEVRKTLYTIKQSYSKEYISEGLWASFLWYMPKRHPLALFLRDCLHLYWEKHDSIIAYLLTDHLIKVFYDYNQSFQSEISKLIVENSDLYYFQTEEVNQPYDESVWEQIAQRTRFFKCNWKAQKDNSCSNNFLSYYDKILSVG